MKNYLILICILVFSLSSFSNYKVYEDNSVYVCHWKKIKDEVCQPGDFIDWFSGAQKWDMEVLRSLGPRFYCEPGSLGKSPKDGFQIGGIFTDRLYCVYNGVSWIKLNKRS